MTVYLVTQHYFPDETSTAEYMTAIAEDLALDYDVVAISGSAGSAAVATGINLRVLEIANKTPPKGALFRRAFAMLLFGLRAFACIVRLARRGDVVIVVTTPFALPYFTVLAARLRGASSAVILYDLYPEVLVVSGLVGAKSVVARAIRLINGLMFRSLDALVTIGRDIEPRLLQYQGLTSDKIAFIPNWATLRPAFRPLDDSNPFRRSLRPGQFVAGLFGNLGFTHDPETVFEAARRMVDQPDTHFLLSGSGIGWERLKALQAKANLANVTMVDRVPESVLEDFLAAANVWIIPYQKNSIGVSVPSRLYNLLAVGRAVIALSQVETEQAQILLADDVGWVVPPGDAVMLTETIRAAAHDRVAAEVKGRRAVGVVASRYTRAASTRAYRQLVHRLSTRNRPKDEN